MSLRPSRLLPIASLLTTLPAAAQQSWPVHSDHPELAVLQDFDGYRTSAYRDLGRRSPTPTRHALVSDWRGLGPYGGDIEDVQVSPVSANLVLAGLSPASGSGGGLYRSTNSGSDWSPVASLAGLMVHDLAFAPDGTAYAGTVDGVWRSVDGGVTFSALPLGIGVDDQVLDVDVDPNDPQTLWVGVADALGAQATNVLVSTDGGATWTDRTPPLAAPRSCSTLAIDPTNSARVFAGFRGFGGGGEVWVTTNGGASWTNRSAGLPDRPVNDLEHDGTRVFVAGGQLFGNQTFGLYASADDGASWVALHTPSWPSRVLTDIALDPNAAGTILVASVGHGVFRTTNGGATWAFQVGATYPLQLHAVSFAPGSSTTIFLGGSSSGVWKSANGGAGFGPSSAGIPGLDVHSVAVKYDEWAVAFQGLNDGGVYTSIDEGRTWTLEALPAARVHHVQYDDSGDLLALAGGPVEEGVFSRSGLDWFGNGPTGGPGFDTDLRSLRLEWGKVLESIVVVGADTGPGGTEPVIWRMAMPAWTWQKVYEGPLPQRTFRDCIGSTFVLACFTDESGANDGGLVYSANGHTSWVSFDAGLPSAFQGTSLTFHPVGNDLLLTNGADTGAAVYRYPIQTGPWLPLNWPAPAFAVAGSWSNAETFSIATRTPARVLETTDGGATFSDVSTGLAADSLPRDLQIAGFVDEFLLATSQGTYSTGFTDPPTPFCFGDGSHTPCPCAPPSAAGTGCLNSFGTGGRLDGTGTTSVSFDTLRLAASGLPPTTSVLFFQGTSSGGLPQGDGVRCVFGSVVRIGAKLAVAGEAAYPELGDEDVSSRGLLPSAGGVRHYQAWYRNVAPFCTAAVFNYTSGLSVTWRP